MSYAITVILFGIISLNIYLILLGIFILLIIYFYETIDNEKDRLIQGKRFNNELKKTSRLN